MSGVAALLRLDGGPATAALLAPALAELAARGPEGEGVVTDGPAVLGYRRLDTTPEAVTEPMPLCDPATGCLLSADVRLDNRDTLLTAFGLDGAAGAVGDGALILSAWRRWGENCAEHLIGDFAFVLWDPRRQRLFAARDQMGMRQLIYTHRPGRRFACSSSARATALISGAEVRLNELRMAEALIDREVSDLTSTFYEDIFRLPPGHCLTLDEKGVSCRAYWRLQPVRPMHLGSDGEYAEAFQDVLSTAVRSRLRGAGPVGSMLSGGVDSGAVVALAAPMQAGAGRDGLPTFSVVGPDPENCVETRAIRAVLRMANIAPTVIDHTRLDPWTTRLIDLWQGLEEPFDFHMTVPRLAYLAARDAGVRVVLDGAAGDSVLGEADQMIQTVRAGHWQRAWRDARGLRAFWGAGSDPAWRQVGLAARSAATPDWLRALRHRWRLRRPPTLPGGGVIDPDFARRVGLIDRLEEQRAARPPVRRSFPEARVEAMLNSGLFVGRERYDRTAAAIGVEPRDPFMDLGVVEFSLGLPMEQLQSGGWPKVVLRRALAGHLPDDVRWRRGKEHLGWDATMSVLTRWPGWQAPIDAWRGPMIGRFYPSALAPERFFDLPDRDLPPLADHALTLSLFLNHAVSADRR